MRFAIGGASWFVPGRTMRLLGVDPNDNGAAAYALRLFGVRDAVLGVALMTTSGEDRRLWWRIGMACDLADVAASVVAAVRKELPPHMGIVLAAVCVAGASLGGAALAKGDV